MIWTRFLAVVLALWAYRDAYGATRCEAACAREAEETEELRKVYNEVHARSREECLTHARLHVIPRALAEELRVWMLKTEGQLLFPGVRGGPLPNNDLNRWYRQLANEADVREITSHGARHTSGSSYAFMGASQKAIAVMLGHADTKATERYTHFQTAATAPLVEGRG